MSSFLIIIGAFTLIITSIIFFIGLAENLLKAALWGLVGIIASGVMIGFGLFFSSLVEGTIKDIKANNIIFIDEDKQVWVYETNEYVVNEYKIGDTIGLIREEVILYEDYKTKEK